MSEDDNKIDQPGAALRAARIRANIGLKEVADSTRIPLHRLEGLERDDYEAVGGQAYVMGYARAYARAIGVDQQPFVAGLEAIFAQQQAASDADRAHAVRRSRMKPKTLLAAATGLFLVVVLTIAYLLGAGRAEASGSDTAAGASSLPSSPAPLPVPAPTLSQVATPAAAAAGAELSADAEVFSEATESTVLHAHLEVESVDPPPVAVPLQAQSVEPPALEAVLDRLHLSFSDECWVEVADASGKTVIARLAQSGDNLPLSGRAPFDITLGNAAAVSVALNGEPVPVRSRSSRRVLKLRVGE